MNKTHIGIVLSDVGSCDKSWNGCFFCIFTKLNLVIMWFLLNFVLNKLHILRVRFAGPGHLYDTGYLYLWYVVAQRNLGDHVTFPLTPPGCCHQHLLGLLQWPEVERFPDWHKAILFACHLLIWKSPRSILYVCWVLRRNPNSLHFFFL